MGEPFATFRAEPGADRPPVDGDGSRVDPAAAPTSLVVQSWSKSPRYLAASAGDLTVTMTFSSRVHESAVQFIEPVQTASASRTMYLWCIRSGTPGIGAVGNGSASIRLGFVRGGGGIGFESGWSTL